MAGRREIKTQVQILLTQQTQVQERKRGSLGEELARGIKPQGRIL
jgi:hypothetical protein